MSFDDATFGDPEWRTMPNVPVMIAEWDDGFTLIVPCSDAAAAIADLTIRRDINAAANERRAKLMEENPR